MVQFLLVVIIIHGKMDADPKNCTKILKIEFDLIFELDNLIINTKTNLIRFRINKIGNLTKNNIKY